MSLLFGRYPTNVNYLMVYISVRITEEITVYEAINVFCSSNKHDILLSNPQTSLRSLPLEVTDKSLKNNNNKKSLATTKSTHEGNVYFKSPLLMTPGHLCMRKVFSNCKSKSSVW